MLGLDERIAEYNRKNNRVEELNEESYQSNVLMELETMSS